MKKIELHGHRGARGLMPENTMPAFEKAVETGVDTLELDTVLTADRQLVITHDTEISPGICRLPADFPESRKIAELPLEQIRRLDCGYRGGKFPRQKEVPGTHPMSLGEFLAIAEKKWPGRNRYNIEIKLEDDEPVSAEFHSLVLPVFSAAISAVPEKKRITLQCFDPALLRYFRDHGNLNVRFSALFKPGAIDFLLLWLGSGDFLRRDILRRAQESGADVISPYQLYVTSAFVRDAHARKMLVLPWTVNKKADMKKMADLGADGIISDYPDMLSQLFLRP